MRRASSIIFDALFVHQPYATTEMPDPVVTNPEAKSCWHVKLRSECKEKAVFYISMYSHSDTLSSGKSTPITTIMRCNEVVQWHAAHSLLGNIN
jgi:hypothetical protein